MDEEPVHMTAQQEERFYRTFWEFFNKTRGPLCNSCGHHQDWHLSYKCVKCEEKDAYHPFERAPIT